MIKDLENKGNNKVYELIIIFGGEGIYLIVYELAKSMIHWKN